MFSRPTVFIIGAGASKEVGLPVGSELAAIISDLLTFRFEFGQLKSGDDQFFFALKRHLKSDDSVKAHLRAAAQISNGIETVNSIDNYIDIHRYDPRIAACGKAAIIYSILNAERSSQIWIDPLKPTSEKKLNLTSLKNTWLVEFGRILVEGIQLSDLDKIFSNITIICFNYDRVIEEFLVQWLSATYSIAREKASDLVQNLTILRPYGSVGNLASGITFGQPPSGLDIWNRSSQIKTYTEQIEDEVLLDTIRSSISLAEILIFLGFGFHRQNLKLLSPEEIKVRKAIFASGLGFSPADTQALRRELNLLFHKKEQPSILNLDTDVHIDSLLTCHGVFTTFRRSLNPQ